MIACAHGRATTDGEFLFNEVRGKDLNRDRDARDLIDRVNDLLNEWDPIGVVDPVREAENPLDEYRSYAPTIADMLLHGATPDALAAKLSTIVTERMGLRSTNDKEMPTARKLHDWYQQAFSDEKGDDR